MMYVDAVKFVTQNYIYHIWLTNQMHEDQTLQINENLTFNNIQGGPKREVTMFDYLYL